MAWQRRAGTQPAEQSHCRRTQPEDSPLSTGLEETHGPQLAGFAAKTQLPDDVGLSLAVQVSGGSAEILATMKAGADLPTPVPTPPIAFACHCPYPLP